jgi:dienelactone hydrolase
MCVSREFSVWAGDHSSPIIERLRALCRELHAELGGRGVGAIGMCLTGNFALSMLVEPSLMAPVLSQPSLPFAPVGPGRGKLHASADEIACARRRIADDGVRVLGLRFTHDALCPGERFETLRRELGDGFEGIEIDSSRHNAHGIKRTAHSVLTADLVDRDGHPTRQALDRVIAFLHEHLDAGRTPG